MISVQTDFRNRVSEIESYFTFIKQVDLGVTLLIKKDSREPVYTPNDQSDLIRTFKASSFLLLYNLMESTVNNAIEAIFDEFLEKSISFDSCRKAIRRTILDNLKQHNVDKILPELNNLPIDIVTKTFIKNDIVSGNVDARKIRGIADEYGFAHPVTERGGDDLLIVKTSRNDLAHGNKSFSEIGKDYSVDDVILKKDNIIKYLEAMLDSVAEYIRDQKYLSTNEIS
ncbi:MAG: MAE_28990/MAE_18760 family HEPN-like nuclease [Leptospira sp.]|nr:MAE_28990/MAE_18760 family HEPN-like nuclease [Leptospira sp.]